MYRVTKPVHRLLPTGMAETVRSPNGLLYPWDDELPLRPLRSALWRPEAWRVFPKLDLDGPGPGAILFGD